MVLGLLHHDKETSLNNAKVIVNVKNNYMMLYSYYSHVITYDEKSQKVTIYNYKRHNKTTRKHIVHFMRGLFTNSMKVLSYKDIIQYSYFDNDTYIFTN